MLPSSFHWQASRPTLSSESQGAMQLEAAGTPTFARVFELPLLRSLVTSVLATSLDGLVFHVLRSLSVPAPVAVAVGCLAGGLIGFTLGRTWVFAVRAPLVPMAVRYGVVSLATALAASLGMAAVTSLPFLPVSWRWASVRAAVYMLVTYPLFARWTFVERARHGDGVEQSDDALIPVD